MIALFVSCAMAIQGAAVPPPMPQRAIAPPTAPVPGEQLELVDGDSKFVLFLPKAFEVAKAEKVRLTMHFHGAPWFAIDEQLRRGLAEPLLVASLGEGSSVYGKAFQDRERFGRLLKGVEAELRNRGAGPGVVVDRVDVSSFSAGYGAVRELLKSPEIAKRIYRIVLGDSLYASFEGGDKSRAAKEHIDPWVEFCKAAARGEKSFALTHSQVPTETYANSALCARALVEAVGGTLVPVEAAKDAQFPLIGRCDIGNFHVWSYGGTDAQAHMTHARHIADVWLALDKAERLLSRG
jgi:hypothetical protein